MDNSVDRSFLPSPLGWLQVIERDNVLVSLSFSSRHESSLILGKVAQVVARLLARYFVGELGNFTTIPLPLTVGTDFQRQVWQTLREIPYGQTVSYRQVAEMIDRPSAYRAVARAIAGNPWVIIVPCHRVVRNDGQLGGYAGGIERKRQLLKMEQMVVKTMSGGSPPNTTDKLFINCW